MCCSLKTDSYSFNKNRISMKRKVCSTLCLNVKWFLPTHTVMIFSQWITNR